MQKENKKNNQGKKPKLSNAAKVMKYSKGNGLSYYRFRFVIPPINQYMVLKNQWEVDYIDVVILYAIDLFIKSGGAKRIIDDQNTSWYWVAEGKIIRDLPLLPLSSEESVRKRIAKLCDCGLVRRNPDNRANGTKYIRIIEETFAKLEYHAHDTTSNEV